jgi:hypothetical protein
MKSGVLVAWLCALVAARIVAVPETAGAQTIPFWESSFVFNNTTYSIRLVGTNPTRGAKTTLVANTIVPMRLVFSDGKMLDAQREVAPLLASQYTPAPLSKVERRNTPTPC